MLGRWGVGGVNWDVLRHRIVPLGCDPPDTAVMLVNVRPAAPTTPSHNKHPNQSPKFLVSRLFINETRFQFTHNIFFCSITNFFTTNFFPVHLPTLILLFYIIYLSTDFFIYLIINIGFILICLFNKF